MTAVWHVAATPHSQTPRQTLLINGSTPFAEADWSRVNSAEPHEAASHPPGLLYKMLPPLLFQGSLNFTYRRPTHP